MRISLDERLSAILAKLELGDRVVDVGADHGKLAVKAAELTEEGVIATDISLPSLNKARLLAEKVGLTNMQFRLGDGLSVIAEGEADTVVIAGMGGREIIKILSATTLKFKKYVLSPQATVSELTDFLDDRGIKILSMENLRCKGKSYCIIVATDEEI